MNAMIFISLRICDSFYSFYVTRNQTESGVFWDTGIQFDNILRLTFTAEKVNLYSFTKSS
jgi:hypothetical protein